MLNLNKNKNIPALVKKALSQAKLLRKLHLGFLMVFFSEVWGSSSHCSILVAASSNLFEFGVYQASFSEKKNKDNETLSFNLNKIHLISKYEVKN